MRAWLPYIRGRFTHLLVGLLSLFLLYPFLRDTYFGVRMVDAFLSLILVAAVFSVARRREHRYGVIGLAAVTLAVNWVTYGVAARGLEFAAYAAYVAFFATIAVIVLRHAVAAGRVTFDKISAAVCVYLCIGLIWAHLFAMIELASPGAFHQPMQAAVAAQASDGAVPEGGSDEGTPRSAMVNTRSPFLYYSFVTLSTLGYGDITPVSPPARALSALESLVGQIYLAVLIARLVGLHIAEGRGESAVGE